MTLATTQAKILTVLSGATCANVHSRVRNDIDRADAEAALISGGAVQSWEVSSRPETVLEGCDGYYSTELDVEILAHWKAADAGDSRGAFMTQIAAVQAAILHRTNGFPQVKEPGVALVEFTETPIRLRTGQSAYRARLRFRLWNVSNT